MIARFTLVFALLTGMLASRPNGWTHFVSAEYRYSAFYPPGWHQLSPGSQSLDIINFPDSRRVTGSLIPADGADLQAGPTNQPGTIEEQIEKAEMRDGVVSPSVDQTLVTGLSYANACKTLREVEYDFNLGDAEHPVYQHWTALYCKANGRIFAVGLLYFRGNRDAKMLNALALDVARSLRIEK